MSDSMLGEKSMRYGDSPAVGQSHDAAETTALSSTCPDGGTPLRPG